MADASTHATVRITSRPLWQIRLLRGFPRYLLYALCAAGLAASARFAVDPPRADAPAHSRPSPSPPELAAQGFATLFVRRYLTWDAAEPAAAQKALEPVLGAGIAPDAGLRLPARGEQRVAWAEVVQDRSPALGEHVFTVAAETDTAGLLYVTVSVIRRPDGSLALAGYPAFVGAPASGSAQLPSRPREVEDRALVATVERALRNYLAASGDELAADLTSSARVSLPSLGLTLEALQRLSWSPDRRSVLAVVEARDERGVLYTLAYELDVATVAGRWEISAIQTDPDT
jgi:hypothetical protein